MKIRGRHCSAGVLMSVVSCTALVCMAGCGNDTKLTTVHYLADNASDFSIDDITLQDIAETAENPVVELSTWGG